MPAHLVLHLHVSCEHGLVSQQSLPPVARHLPAWQRVTSRAVIAVAAGRVVCRPPCACTTSSGRRCRWCSRCCRRSVPRCRRNRRARTFVGQRAGVIVAAADGIVDVLQPAIRVTAVVGADIAVVAVERRAGLAGASRVALADAVAHVVAIVTLVPGLDRVVLATGNRVAIVLGARVVVVAVGAVPGLHRRRTPRRRCTRWRRGHAGLPGTGGGCAHAPLVQMSTCSCCRRHSRHTRRLSGWRRSSCRTRSAWCPSAQAVLVETPRAAAPANSDRCFRYTSVVSSVQPRPRGRSRTARTCRPRRSSCTLHRGGRGRLPAHRQAAVRVLDVATQAALARGYALVTFRAAECAVFLGHDVATEGQHNLTPLDDTVAGDVVARVAILAGQRCERRCPTRSAPPEPGPCRRRSSSLARPSSASSPVRIALLAS